MKRTIAILCSAAITLSMMTACSNSNETASVSSADYSGQTITGQVTSIDGTSITLQLGEWTENSGGAPDGQTPPEQTDTGSGETAPPEKPDGEQSTDSGGGTPPEKPSSGSDTAEPPEKPDEQQAESGSGEQASDEQTPPDMPNGGGAPSSGSFTAGEDSAAFDFSDASVQVESGAETADGSLDDISVNAIVVAEIGDDNKVTSVTVKSTQNAGFGGSSEVTQGTSANTIDSDASYSDCTYSSSGDDENALRIDGASAQLDSITVEKSAGASSNTEDGDFYGMNAALLATNGAQVSIKNASVTSSAQNGNGVFSYGEGTTVNISDSSITTTADNSGGIQTTGGGTTNASNLTVETSGNSSAAIRSDRGGGTVTVDSGSYTSNGVNSPAVYSTADITVKNAALSANNSEALVIEGKNAIALENCDVSGNMSDSEGSSSEENVHNVMIYQSMSGDADEGTSEFSMTGGTLTSKNGDMIYVTNTHCIIDLSNVTIKNQDSDGYLLRVVGNSASHGWGTAGSNGGQAELTADAQTLDGNIIVDDISTLSMTLTNNSTFTGTVNITDNEQDGTPVDDNAVITIDEGSTWNLTDDCTITSLTNNGTINFNGHTITLADGTVLS